MKNLYTESSYDRNESPKAFPFYQNYQQNTYFTPSQGTEKNLLFDPNGISDPMNWGLKPQFQREPTEEEARTLNQVLTLSFGNVMNNSLVTLGKDPSQGLYLRQLIGQAAMQPVKVADEDINDEGVAREQTKLNDLMMQPEDRLKQEGMSDLITQSMSKLAYMKARLNNTLVVPANNIANYYRGQGQFGQIVGALADTVIGGYDNAVSFAFGSGENVAIPARQRLSGDGLRILQGLGFDNKELLTDIEKETGELPSTSTADMVALVESFDRSFDFKTWFNEKIALDPTVRNGLLNYGITEDLFRESRNSTHALMTLMSKMNTSDIQRRLSNYVPSTYQSIVGLAKGFKDGLLGNLDTAAEVALEIGGTIAVDTAIGAGFAAAPTAGIAAPEGALIGAAVGIGESVGILYKTLSAAKKVMSSAWYLTGYGKLPRYAMQWGAIRTTGASALVGAISNSVIDYVGQKENIALANSLYFYNPDMQSVFSMEEVLGAAESGAIFGASLGMIGHVISTGLIASNNAKARRAFIEQGIDPAFAPQQRNPFQTTKDNIAAFRNRKVIAIQDPISGAIQTALSKGKEPTVVDINSVARATSTAIDAASVAGSPNDAANLPDHSLNRRQPNEPMRAYTIRAVMGKFVTSITDLLDADSSGGRFSQLTPREQYLTLLRTEDHMRDFSTMTDIETDLNNKVAGRPEQVRIIDPVTGRSSSPADNVAKLYSELDEAKSTLEKTISKEDRAEARLAHKNGTELAPRTISSAVDKAASNVRGIMENASEGRHNPSEAKGPKVDTEATTGVPVGENAAQGTTAPATKQINVGDTITVYDFNGTPQQVLVIAKSSKGTIKIKLADGTEDIVGSTLTLQNPKDPSFVINSTELSTKPGVWDHSLSSLSNDEISLLIESRKKHLRDIEEAGNSVGGKDSAMTRWNQDLIALESEVARRSAQTTLTQGKVNEITKDAAEDMSLLTDEELEDPKVTGAIERNINRQLFGEEKEHTLRSLSRGLAKARKLTPGQQKKINASLDNPRSFLKNATGNKTYIKNFFNRLDQLVTLGHITDVDRRIILASTVNTVFQSNVAAKISDMGTRADDRASTSLQGDIKIGKLDTSVAGNTRVENVLHEIGHVEELHAYGSPLMNLRKLFTSEGAFLKAAQEVLGTDNFNKYYIAGNTQELMAQVKAKMMIDEVKLAVFLKTANSTAVEKTLLHRFLSVGTTLVEVFNSLKLSKVDAEDEMYTAVKNVLSQLEKNSGPLMTRITYQNRVTEALKQFPATGKKLSPSEKVAFTKVLNDKVSAKLTKTEPSLKDMLFTKDEVQSLHALTVHADGTVDPIRLDAYLNVKRDGITVKNRAKFAKTFQSYVEINKRYLASTVDIHIQSMKENGYKAVPNNPIVMDSSLNRKDQIIALREYHKNLTPEQLVVTPSYLDISFGSFQGIQSINFLLETAAEPSVTMFAPMDSFVMKLKNIVGLNTVTLEAIVGGAELDPSHIGKALQMLKVDKMITIEQIKTKLAQAEMVVELSEPVRKILADIQNTTKNKLKVSSSRSSEAAINRISDENYILTQTKFKLDKWIENSLLNASVNKRENLINKFNSVLDNLTTRIVMNINSYTVMDEIIEAESFFNTKTIDEVVKETNAWAFDYSHIKSNTYSPTKPENVILEFTFEKNMNQDERYENTYEDLSLLPPPVVAIKGTKGTWQKVLGVDVDIEAKKMKHCVLQYKESIESGRTDVYSLRDADNNPLATVGIKYDGTAVFQASGYSNDSIRRFANEVNLLINHLGIMKSVNGVLQDNSHLYNFKLFTFNVDEYKEQKFLARLKREPDLEKKIVDDIYATIFHKGDRLAPEQQTWLRLQIKDNQISPLGYIVLAEYIRIFRHLPISDTYIAGIGEKDPIATWLKDQLIQHDNPSLIGTSYDSQRRAEKVRMWQTFILESIKDYHGKTNTLLESVYPSRTLEQKAPIFYKQIEEAMRSELINGEKVGSEIGISDQFLAFINNSVTTEKQYSYYIDNEMKYRVDTLNALIKDSRLFVDQSALPPYSSVETEKNFFESTYAEYILPTLTKIRLELRSQYGWAADIAFFAKLDADRNAINYKMFDVAFGERKILKENLQHIEDVYRKEFLTINLSEMKVTIQRNQDAAEYGLEMGDLFAPQRKPTNVGNYIVMDTVRGTLDSLLTSTNTNELPRLPQRVREATNLLQSATSIDINKFTVRVVKDPKENVGFIPNIDKVGGVITVLDRGSIEANKDMPLLLLTDLMKAMESQGQGKRLKKVKELLSSKETKFDKMFKDTVVTYPNSTEPMALRHSSPLPIPYEDFPSDIRFKIGLTGGDEALGAGVYLTNNGGDGSKYGNYNTDVYVNIKKPFIVDTLGYLKTLKTDPRRLSVPFSSTRNVFNYQISHLLEKFITENKIEVDPTWLKNLQDNRVHAVRDLPDTLKEALELQDGTWQKSYEKIGIWEEQKSNLISQELLDSAGNNPHKLNDIMREHSSRASITVPVQAEARIIAHRLLQRMGYDGIFAPSFQYYDYSGQVTVTNNDHYVILDPKQARSINNVSFNETATGLMFAPKSKLPVAYTKTTAVRRLATLSNEISDSPQTNAEFKNNIQTMFGVDDKLFTALLSNIKKPEVSITTTRKIPVVKEEPLVPLTPEQIKAQEQKALYSTVPDENIITDPSLIGTTNETIRGTGTGELVNYHQTIIRRIVKALDSGKLTVGVNGIRRLNLVERKLAILDVHEHAQLVNDLEIADAKFEPSDLTKINELIKAREDDDLNNSKLRPNDPLTSESLNRFWKERFDVARQIGSRLKRKFSSLGFKNSQTSLDAILTAMNTAQARGDATLVRQDGTIRTRNHLLNYLANSAWQIIIKELTPQETRAGLTGANWGLFIETENEIINSSYYTDAKELKYDGTNEQWMESEKKSGSMLYQQFVKAYGTKYDLKGEASNVEGEPPQLVSTIRGEDKEYSAKLDRKSKAFRFIIDLAEENKYSLFDKKDKGWMEFVVRNIIEGKEYAEIVTLGRDVGYNKTVNNVKDAHRFFKENVKKFTELFLPEGLTIDDLDGNQVLASMVVENMRKKTELDSDLAFKTKTENEILQDSQRATEEQNNTDELEQHIDTTDPAEETSQPVISPKESEEPVTAVIQVEGKTTPVTGLTPHVTPVVAERVVQQGRNPNGQFTSSTPKRSIKFITGDFRAWGKATGVAGKLFFASFKTMEGILLSLPKDSLKKINVAQAVDILTRLFEDGKEKEAIKQFMSLMEHLDIEGVKLIDPKDGRTVMNFIFDQHQWSYGGISRFVEPKVAPKTEAKVAPKTEAKAKPKAAPATTTTPAVTTPTTPAAVAPASKPKLAGKGTAPDGTTVPVIQPKAVEVTDLPEGSHIPIISEHDRIANGLIESNESLRDGGVDATSFTALFKKFVRSLSKDARKKLGTGIPESFKSVFIDFVELNASIMHHNRTIFGSEKIIQKFWKQVDILLAVEDGLTIKNQLRVRKSMKEIYAAAADMVSINNTKFIPPVTHDSVIMRNGKFSLGTISKEVKSVLDARDTSGNPLIPYTTEELRSREQAKPKDTPLPGVANSKITRAPEEELVPEVELTNSNRIDTIASKVNNSSNMLLRQNNFISLIFGGSERSNRNRWRLFMSKAVNFIQMGSNMGSTLRSMHLTVRFLSMLMDDSRAMTGQLVSPEGIPIKSAAKAKQDAVMFTANLTRIHHALSSEAISLKMTPEEKKLLQKIQIKAWKNKTSPTSSELTAAFGEKDFSKLESILKNYRLELIHLNTEVLKLEEKTQWRTVVDKNGDLVEAEDYLPIQVHVEKLMSILSDNERYKTLMASIVNTRKESKLADDMLDVNTLITMGILNIEKQNTFYTKNRKFALTSGSMLDSDSLSKLYEYSVASNANLDFSKQLGIKGKDWFLIEKGNEAKVYRIPKTIEDLSEADLVKYRDTVKGEQQHVTSQWKQEFNGKSLIEVEMKELLDFKTKQGKYHYSKTTMVDNRPVLDRNHHDDYFSTVRNFSVDELLSDSELFNIARTDLHSAYQNFAKYRMFDLIFQESIDQLAGSTGLRPKDFFRLLEDKVHKHIEDFDSIKAVDKKANHDDVASGFSRLIWQYAQYNGSTPRLGAESRIAANVARATRNLVSTSSGLGWGLSQAPETIMEILKNIPSTKGLSVPVGMFKYLNSLLNFWNRGDSATRFQVEDLITSLEEYSKDHSTHFNEGIGDIDFDSDTSKPYRAIWNSGRNSSGLTGNTADFLEKIGQTTVLAGGVTDGTNLARYYGKARHVRDLTAMMRDGKLKEFLRLRALPENRAAMQALLEGSFKSAAEERKLWKMHKSLARQAGGLDSLLALKAIKVGLDSPAKLEAMMYGMNAANALDGVLDFRDLHMVYRDLKNMKDPPIDPELYRATASDFQFGIEGLVRKRTVTHSFGLNQTLSAFHSTEVGKLLGSLTSYMRSWFDDVMLNAPERGAVGLMFGGIISAAVLETVISLLREWMSGREMEDIMAELENDPSEFVLRIATRMPVIGSLSPVFEGGLREVKYMTGGAQRGSDQLIKSLTSLGGGSPNVGINSVASLLNTVKDASGQIINGSIEGDSKLVAKGLLKVPGHFINKSPQMLPVRILEEQMDLDDQHAAQFIIDGLQKRPYQFLSQRNSGSGSRGRSSLAPQSSMASPVTTQTMPQSIALRNAQRPDMGRQVKEYVAPAPPSKPNSGVSERLGKLLDNPSYKHTPPM